MPSRSLVNDISRSSSLPTGNRGPLARAGPVRAASSRRAAFRITGTYHAESCAEPRRADVVNYVGLVLSQIHGA
jgi:hypothetical protein